MPLRVLIVEDENIVALDIRRQLERLGYDVMVPQARGEEALEAARREEPGLVLMDIQLRGELDGIAAGRSILEMGIPVILLTAYTDEKTISRAREIGPYGYIVKPYNERILRTTIEMAIHRHRMEVEAERRKYLFESTLNSISEAVVVTGMDQQLRFMNQAAKQLFPPPKRKFREGERGESSRGNRFPGDYGEVIRSSGEVYFKGKEGKAIPVEMNWSELQEGAEQGEVWAFRDISQRRAMERELRQSHKMEALGRLAGGIAHDFNNILTVILGYGTLLDEKLSGGETAAQEQVEGLRRAARKARDLVRHLLVFSRQQVLETREIRMIEVLKGWREMLNRLIGADIEIRYRIDLESGADTVAGDAAQIEQMLINLTANARDSMPGGGLVEISLECVDLDEPLSVNTGILSPGSYVALAVKDQGVGMDEETVSRVFDPFFTTKGEMTGTGLGLATVYGIVRQLGGEIAIDSRPEGGSRFMVYIPRREGQPEAAGTPGWSSNRVPDGDEGPLRAGLTEGDRVSESNETQPVTGALRGRRVWVVQRDQGLGKLIKHLIESRGGEVFWLENAGEALLAAEEAFQGASDSEKPGQGKSEAAADLVVSDLVIPRLDGKRFLDRLRKVMPGVQGMLLTEYTPEQLAKKGLETGDYPLLRKPFEGEDFLRLAQKILGDD